MLQDSHKVCPVGVPIQQHWPPLQPVLRVGCHPIGKISRVGVGMTRLTRTESKPADQEQSRCISSRFFTELFKRITKENNIGHQEGCIPKGSPKQIHPPPNLFKDLINDLSKCVQGWEGVYKPHHLIRMCVEGEIY